MNIILQPAGNSLAKAHFDRTVANGVPKTEFLQKISSKLVRAKVNQLNLNPVRVWGVVSGEINNTHYRKLEPGDLVLFCGGSEIFAYGEVILAFQDANLARYLWETDKGGKPWQNIYLIKNFHNTSIPIAELNRALGYRPNYNVRGFTVIHTAPKQAQFFGTFRYEQQKLSLLT